MILKLYEEDSCYKCQNIEIFITENNTYNFKCRKGYKVSWKIQTYKNIIRPERCKKDNDYVII